MDLAAPATNSWVDTAMRRVLLLGAVLAPFNYVVNLPAGDVTLHPLQLWAVMLVMCALVLRPQAIVAAADSPSLLVWTMFAFVVASTLFATPEVYRTRGFLDVILLAINLATFTLVYGLLRTNATWWAQFARVLFGASIVSSGILVARAFTVAGGGALAAQPDSFSLGLGTVTGTFTAALTAASLVGMVFAKERSLRFLMFIGVGVHGPAASLSLARGPWLAGAIGAGMTFVLAARLLPDVRAVVRAVWRGAVAVTWLGVATVTTSLANATVTRLVASRVLEATNLGSGTGRARINLFQALLEDAMDTPVFGHGAASYRAVSELLQRQGAISENFLLEMFHAGGAMAALPLVLATAVVTIRLLGSLRAVERPGLAAICLAGVLALLAGALSNPAAWDTAFWVVIATAAALHPVLLPPTFAPTPALATSSR